MSEEEIKKIVRDTFYENIMNNLNGYIIFKYIQELEKENQKYKETIDKAIKYIKANEFYLDYSTGACIKGVMPLLNILKEVE